MSKNYVRQYEDGFFDEDAEEGIERLKHHTKHEEKELEKKKTVQRKKIRKGKDRELDSGEV